MVFDIVTITGKFDLPPFDFIFPACFESNMNATDL